MYDLSIHWQRTLARNPLYYWGAIGGMALLAVARWRGRASGTHVLAATYGAVVFALCRWHKQPWPYFFVILIPSLMVVHVAALHLLLRVPRWRPVLLVVLLAVGVGWPLRYMPDILDRDNQYQRHVVSLTRAILDEDDTYLAGTDLVYDRRQAVTALRRLSAPRLDAVRNAPSERIDALIAAVEGAKPKLVIDDTRMRLLPPALRAYLDAHFEPLWSSVNTYAPLVPPQHQFELWFEGSYRVETEGDAIVDGRRYQPGAVLQLDRGPHRNSGLAPVRLRMLVPQLAAFADPAMRKRRLMFARVYDY
jgi:hypothetical protein